MTPTPSSRSSTPSRLRSRLPRASEPRDDWNAFDDEETQQLPRRPRRQFFNRRIAALLAVLTCAIGFYAGVRVEKRQLATTPVTIGATGAAGAGRAGGGTAGSAGTAGAAATSRAGSGYTGLFGRGATAGGASGSGAGGGAAIGTVASISGKTLDLTETSGNTVKVKLSSATKVSKTESVKSSAIHPGDTLIVEGVTSGSTVTAASVTDSGTRSGGSGGFGSLFGGGAASGSGSSSSAGASGSGSSGSSAVGSLFNSGG